MILFYVERVMVSVIYEKTDYESITDQMGGKINFSLIFLGNYIMILTLVSTVGFFGARRKKEEISKGFLYSTILCMVLILIFLALIIYLFIG